MNGQPPQPAPEAAQDAVEPLPIRPFTMDEARLVRYSKDVAPIIEAHCAECHNPDKSKSDLDLSSVETMMVGGKKAGPSIVPGQPDDSPVVQYIQGLKRPRMPKGEDPISADELHVIRMWIAAGAEDDTVVKVPAEPAPGAPA
jgi:hypothetical protein